MRINRIDLIEEYILKNKSASLNTLCEKFEVSKNTIRRDIDTLVEKGSIKKVYGGVTKNCNPSTLLSFDERNSLLLEEKDNICKIAATFVEDNDIIFIDTGTTCLNMIKHIGDKKYTLITNSLSICTAAVPFPNINVISLPGKLKRETLSYVGNEINDYLKIYNINKAFMASTGVSIESGLTNASIDEHSIKKCITDTAKSIFLLADSTKFDKFSLTTYCALEKVDFVITDKLPKQEFLDFFAKNNIQYNIAK